jgi:hypothetical protein
MKRDAVINNFFIDILASDCEKTVNIVKNTKRGRGTPIYIEKDRCWTNQGRVAGQPDEFVIGKGVMP